jgi:2-haloacid dehalogenase
MSDWATFDCYGTLADWVTGMSDAVRPLAGDATPRLMAAYYEAELEVEHARPGARYREILAESLRGAAARTGVELPDGGEHALAEHWGDMPIFGDVGDALGRLRADGWRLAILSNCDDDLLASTVARMPVEFDLLVTAEQVGSYKPAHGHWHRFAELTASERDAWVHVAQSYVHDMVPAHALGLPRVWIDRLGDERDPSIVTAHLHDLGPLPATLEAIRRGGSGQARLATSA